MQIMKETMVEFISVELSVYHCLLFLDQMVCQLACLRLPAIHSLWLSPSGVNHQSGLSTTGWGRLIPVDEAIASPQADATWRGVLCLRKMVPAVWGMTQHRNPSSCSLSSVHKATIPRLSSSISSPLCPSFPRAQGKWLQMKLCALVL